MNTYYFLFILYNNICFVVYSHRARSQQVSTSVSAAVVNFVHSELIEGDFLGAGINRVE